MSTDAARPAGDRDPVGLKRVSLGPAGQRLEHHPDLSDDERFRRFGAFELAGPWPASIVAGAPTTLELLYRAGHHGLPTGASVALLWRLPADWAVPQFDRPGDANYATVVRTDGEAELELGFSHQAGVPPWHHGLSVTVTGRDLPPSAVLRLTCGDTSGGGPGWEAQTSSLPDHRFLAVQRRDPGAPWIRLPDLPTLRIVGGEAAGLAASCPSACVQGEPLRIIVRGVDRWGNVSRGGRGAPEVTGDGLRVLDVRPLDWDGAPHDLWHVSVRLDRAGIVRPRVRWRGLTAEANPVRCHDHLPAQRLCWGDLHGGQGDLGVGHGSLERYFDFADRVAGLEFTSHQANDVYVTQADWDHTRAVTDAFHRPGAFAALLGCEWTAAVDRGGDHNVVYRHDRPELRRASRWFADAHDWPDAPTPPDLYASLADTEALLSLHVGGFTSDLNHHDERLQRLIEIHSTHATSRWFVADALERGYELGIVAGSDGIAGRPGACRPGRRQTRNLRSGVTGVYAADLTRDALWEALVARRCFATTGERIALWVEADGHPMGSSFRARSAPPLRVRATGTAAIERVTLLRGPVAIDERRLAGPDPNHPNRYRLLWQGSRGRGAARHQRLDWDGVLRVAGGAVTPVATVGFEEPLDRLLRPAADALAWSSVTAGSEAGVVFDVEAPSTARFTFRSGALAFDWARAEVEQGVRLELPGVLDGRLTCERAPDPTAPRDVDLTLVPPAETAGRHAYWVEVVQVDGARAWSSPLYLTIGPYDSDDLPPTPGGRP